MRALAQLAVFEGGFSLEAAEAVLELESAWAMDAVQSLVDKSLVRPSGDERFDLLVSVQDYASERLGENRVDVEVRHGAWFAALGSPEALERFQEALGFGSPEVSPTELHFQMALSHINLEEYADARPHLDAAGAPERRAASSLTGSTETYCANSSPR